MASLPSCCGCGVLGVRSGERRSVNNSSVVMHIWRTSLEEIGVISMEKMQNMFFGL
jgi:hypothetical protein